MNELVEEPLKKLSAPPHWCKKFDWRIIIAGILGLAGITIWRATVNHAAAHPVLPHSRLVAVARVNREDLSQILVCDAELRPYQEVEIHAKVSGYLDKIQVDIGDSVKMGDVLATLEVPELQDDIRKASAARSRAEQEVGRAQAAFSASHVAYARLSAVEKSQPRLIAQQDLDAAQEKEQIAASALAAARADVDIAVAELAKLKTMLQYTRITAPFSGTITERYADQGSLIQAGSSSSQALPLVRLSENDRLRLDIPVSVSYVGSIHVGDPIEIHVNIPEMTFTGIVARTSSKVETSTRTMKVQVDVPNPELKLIPGMYATATLRLAFHKHALAVPVAAVSRKSEATVLVVDPQMKIEERSIHIGIETPQKLEVLSGLHEDELVLVGGHSQVKPGELVQPRLLEESKKAE
jgi:RND family efflux transporter MFP subunit